MVLLQSSLSAKDMVGVRCRSRTGHLFLCPYRQRRTAHGSLYPIAHRCYNRYTENDIQTDRPHAGWYGNGQCGGHCTDGGTGAPLLLHHRTGRCLRILQRHGDFPLVNQSLPGLLQGLSQHCPPDTGTLRALLALHLQPPLRHEVGCVHQVPAHHRHLRTHCHQSAVPDSRGLMYPVVLRLILPRRQNGGESSSGICAGLYIPVPLW